jgi:hypothetical protein
MTIDVIAGFPLLKLLALLAVPAQPLRARTDAAVTAIATRCFFTEFSLGMRWGRAEL